jgi:hypothetical protein
VRCGLVRFWVSRKPFSHVGVFPHITVGLR